jgi:hypothetical protein
VERRLVSLTRMGLAAVPPTGVSRERIDYWNWRG